MSIGVILTETVVMAILFTIAVVAGSKNPVDTVYDMPEPIVNRCLELGLIDESKKADSPQTRRKKFAAAIVIALVIAITLFFVNHTENFLQGFLVSYVIWLIIDWYDCFVIDWI
jgi:glycerol uptake facilitator-like aquaporin